LIYGLMHADTLPIALRLADEGVPLRAIARAVQVPSPQIYQSLVEARREGRLVSLPRDDWPPGCPRDQRALQLSRLAADNPLLLLQALRELFHLPPVPARLLLRLTQHEILSRDTVDCSPKCLDVNVCSIRRQLRPLGLKIITVRQTGYRLPLADRARVLELILAKMLPAQAPPPPSSLAPVPAPPAPAAAPHRS
jgi:biotin operon repressor